VVANLAEPRTSMSRWRADDRDAPDPYLLAAARRRATAAVTRQAVQRLEAAGLAVIDARTLQTLVEGVAGPSEVIRVGDWVISPGYFEVRRKGKKVHLTPVEWRILMVVIGANGLVVPHSRLLTLVWGQEYECEFHLLRVNIARLRAKLEPEATKGKGEFKFICTVPSAGYYCGALREERMPRL